MAPEVIPDSCRVCGFKSDFGVRGFNVCARFPWLKAVDVEAAHQGFSAKICKIRCLGRLCMLKSYRLDSLRGLIKKKDGKPVLDTATEVSK